MQKILIVEDDKKLRSELETFLDKHGFIAIGLEKFDNTIGDILNENADLILLDINLPYIDGEFVCKEVRKSSDVPIIMVTSRDNEIDELMSLNYGADQYVTKPYNIQILLAKINGLLKRNQKSEKEMQEIDSITYKSDILRSIDEELDKVENYTEQALFYARSNAVEKDYIINKTNLKEIVNGAILKNKTTLINEKVSIELSNLKDEEVYTDSKWAIFIINQIIQNAIKYSKKEDKKIEISSQGKNDKVILYIKDNGIGIKKGEITRVFERGFTGENGRIIGQKSTGIGLYLCKKLCDKLGLGIELNSEKDKGTEVRVIFPKNSYTDF